ncbi:AMP-binding protein [Mycobacterium sp. SM1]|uniref:AMP-binding protein n=1 Tax=Mycobacterium sp. SM1 TaxID=2816243 RepID=UPI001BCBFF86|nr:AMP-binding protein [Mycobacterium sp. SM1]MBS4726889.1 AMP-binding protein [Mycobacterium sp. SM1]
MAVNESPLITVLRERASLQPDDTAFTFIDYEQDWNGVAESLTWSQLYRRIRNVARALEDCGSAGDRAVIAAPQGLDYVVAFLGALQAGRIAVPLSVPEGRAHDERVTAVLRDASPTTILTTSAAAGQVTAYAAPESGRAAAAIIEVDSLDLDCPRGSLRSRVSYPGAAYLQYTSGSTRQPAGVMVSARNLFANFDQLMSDYFLEFGKVAPPHTTVVSWLPFYHDMGLVLGIFLPLLGGLPAVLTSPVSFLKRPARWMRLLASHSRAFSAAPNFAFELAAQKTSDEDMAGHDLGDVLVIINGSERVQPATVRRFTRRFTPFNLPARAIRPSYGLAEATVYVATRVGAQPPAVVHFDSEKLTAGRAQRCDGTRGTPLVSYGAPQSPMVRVVDPETRIECAPGTVGEIWVHGDNVAMGYWRKPDETEITFGARLAAPSAGTPEGPWLRTGDSGFFCDGELFIIGRIKDLLIVYGRNHSPDDIEATIQEITRGRCAAISVSDEHTEKLVAIIEVKNRGGSHKDGVAGLDAVKRDVTAAISCSHGLSVADLVLVAPGSIPITTSGKVRRAACAERYRQGRFVRLDG